MQTNKLDNGGQRLKDSVRNTLTTDKTLEPIRFCVVTSDKHLSKGYKVDNGELAVSGEPGKLNSGVLTVMSADSLAEVGAVLDSLKSNQATIYGLPLNRRKQQRIFSKTVFEKHGSPADATSRNKENFAFSKGRGFMLIDYDPDKERGESLTREELVNALWSVAGPLTDAPILWAPSASSKVAKSGEPGSIKGQRLYLDVADASKIPEAAKALDALLWANGYGRIEFGKAVQMLERSLVDTSVYQPHGLDFTGAPIVDDGVQRLAVKSEVLQDGEPFDLDRVIVLADANVRREASEAKKAAKAARKEEQAVLMGQWAESLAEEITAKDGRDTETVKQQLIAAHETSLLFADFVVTLQDGTELSVGQILDNPERYHGRRCADPLETGYRSDKRVGYLDLMSGRPPIIYSHAHGGIRYKLRRQTRKLQLAKGERARVADEVLEVLRADYQLFDEQLSGRLVSVGYDGELCAVKDEQLTDTLDRTFHFYHVGKKGEEYPADGPVWLTKKLLGVRRGLPELQSTITAPTLRADFSILDKPGYDPESKLLYVSPKGERSSIPPLPDRAASKEALRVLMAPFDGFDFVAEVDRAVTLAAILTVLVRVSLPTSPGFLVTAPMIGTGKSKLAEAIALLAGTAPVLTTAPKNEEILKHLTSAMMENARCILWDNYPHGARVGDDSLYVFLTSATYTDRVMHTQGLHKALNKTVWFGTGNNLRLHTDSARRIMPIRLDPKMAAPSTRRFDFDPVQRVKAERAKLVKAGLTLMRGYVAATNMARVTDGAVGSFEVWDSLVRQVVAWVADWDNRYADPAECITTNMDEDEDAAKLAGLLGVVWDSHCEKFDREKFTVAGLIDHATREFGSPEAREGSALLSEIAPSGNGRINSRLLAHFFKMSLNRRVNVQIGDGKTKVLYLDKLTCKAQNKTHYRVVEVKQD